MRRDGPVGYILDLLLKGINQDFRIPVLSTRVVFVRHNLRNKDKGRNFKDASAPEGDKEEKAFFSLCMFLSCAVLKLSNKINSSAECCLSGHCYHCVAGHCVMFWTKT